MPVVAFVSARLEGTRGFAPSAADVRRSLCAPSLGFVEVDIVLIHWGRRRANNGTRTTLCWSNILSRMDMGREEAGEAGHEAGTTSISSLARLATLLRQLLLADSISEIQPIALVDQEHPLTRCYCHSHELLPPPFSTSPLRR